MYVMSPGYQISYTGVTIKETYVHIISPPIMPSFLKLLFKLIILVYRLTHRNRSKRGNYTKTHKACVKVLTDQTDRQTATHFLVRQAKPEIGPV